MSRFYLWLNILLSITLQQTVAWPCEGTCPALGFCIDITSYEEYQDLLQSTRDILVVVKIESKTCPGCKFLASGLDELARKYRKQILILNVDYMEVSQPYKEFNCKKVPTIVIFHNGQVIMDPFVTTDKEKVERKIQEALEVYGIK